MNDKRSLFTIKQFGFQWVGYLGIITIFVAALGYFVCKLNELRYLHYVPIYDSMSYTNTLAKSIQIAHNDGIIKALIESLNVKTMVFPWLVSSIIGRFAAPSRMIGVWIQIRELLVLLWSLFYYFHRIRGIHHSLAFAFLIPFVSLAGFYEFNGGLSDFRMDLALFLWFSIAAAWYLIASQSKRILHWCVFRIACGLTCLNRATAPVYLAVSLFPPILAETITIRERTRLLKQLACAGLIAGIISGWFYLVRFDYLYYYYAIWNVDSTAHLPISVAARHFMFALRVIGQPLIASMMLWNVLLVICGKPFQNAGIRMPI